jgi:hypothetical protein
MNNQYYTDGTRVKGTFHGVPYTGVVTMMRPHKLHPTMVKMYVDFDQEIDCGPIFGKRTSGIINAFHPDAICEHTIEAE